MKKLLLIFMMVLICFSALIAEGNYTDKIKDFTYVIPEGWTLISSSNLKYNLAVGEAVDGFAQNIIVQSEEFGVDMDEYILLSIKDLKQVLPNIQILKNEKFENKNVQAWKFITENNYDGRVIRQYFYTFKDNNRFFVCVATVLQDAPEEMEEIFDASMATFKIFPKSENEELNDVSEEPDNENKEENNE